MNIALWIVQGFLALAFVVSGVVKMTQSKAKLLPKMPYVEDFSDRTLKLIGLVEVLGAIGVIAPWATGIAPVLTPLAATGLVIVMGVAAATHVRRKEYSAIAMNALLGGLALFVAIGRF